MKDQEITELVSTLQDHVNSINQLIADLHTKNVEIRISYTESKSDEPAYINLWRAVEHNNYIEESK